MKAAIAYCFLLPTALSICPDGAYAGEHRSIPFRIPYSLTFSPDGRFLAAAGKHQAGHEWGIQIWEVTASKEAGWFQIPGMLAGSLAFSLDGKRLAVAARVDQSVEAGEVGRPRPRAIAAPAIFLFEVGTWKRVGQLAVGEGASAFVFLPDGKYLAVMPQGVQVWDVTKNKVVSEIPEVASAISLSPDGKLLATFSREHGVRIWDLTNLQVRFSHQEHKSLPVRVAFSPDGKTVASSESRGGRVILWKFQTDDFQTFNMFGSGNALRKINTVTGLAFSRDGRWLAVLGHEAIDFIDVANRTLWQYPGRWDDSCRYGVVFSPDGKTLATAGARVVKFWDFEKLLTEKSPDHEMKRPPKPAPPPPPDLK